MRTSFRPASRRHATLAVLLFCATGAALADTSPSAAATNDRQPTAWKWWNGHHYRLEADGHLSCYSEDSSRSDCSINAPDPAKAQPLRCNDQRWGGGAHKFTGYQVADHWCNNAYATLFAPWRDYRPLGHDHELATNPRGDVMCRSGDGTTCLPARLQHERSTRSRRDVRPLVCGSLMRAQAGITGYDQSGHWCQSNEIVQDTFDDDVQAFSETDSSPQRHLDKYLSGGTFKRLPDDGPYAWLVTTQAPRIGTWTRGASGLAFYPDANGAWKMQGTISHAGKAGDIKVKTPLVRSKDLPANTYRAYDTLNYSVRAETDGTFTYRQTLNQPLDPFDATPGVPLNRTKLKVPSSEEGVTVTTTFQHPGLSLASLWTRTVLVKKRSLPDR